MLTLFIRDTCKQVFSNATKCGSSSGSVLFAKIKTMFRDRNHNCNFLTGNPFKIQNGLFHTYCINMYGIVHKNKKGLSQ